MRGEADHVRMCVCFASHPSHRLSPLPALSEIFVHGDLQWDIFQVIISRSTTPDLIKIGMKLQEFFTQQFDTSKRALSTWGPGPYPPPKTPVINAEKGGAELCESVQWPPLGRIGAQAAAPAIRLRWMLCSEDATLFVILMAAVICASGWQTGWQK